MSTLLEHILEVEPDLEWQDDSPPKVTDTLGARRLMIAIRQAEREAEETEALLKDITQAYKQRIDKAKERADLLRQSLETFIRDINGGQKLSLPDVGTAYLAKRKAKVEITDRGLVQQKYGNKFQKAVFDETAFKEHALKVVEETGEVIEGVKYIPEHQALQIRGV